MNKQTKILAIVGSIIVIGGLIVYIRNRGRKPQPVQPDATSGTPDQPSNHTGITTTSQNGTSTGSPADIKPNYKFTFPIKYGQGSKLQPNENVKQLQLLIMQYDNRLLVPYNADGWFGSKTRDALKSIIGKTSVDSQADIDSLLAKGKAKAQNIFKNMFLGIGIK